MRIGILGGSFDPPHFGHLLVARQTLEVVGLDKVWLMPYPSHQWKKTFESAQDRLAMANLIAEKQINVCDSEIKNRFLYTIDSVSFLKKNYPHKFYFIVGSDILAEFDRWENRQDLTKEMAFLVFPRNGFPIPKTLPKRFVPIKSSDLVTTNISSSIVRNRLVKGLSVTGLIPESVLSYIYKHNLYKNI